MSSTRSGGPGPAFAFIVHPRDPVDVWHSAAHTHLACASRSPAELARRLRACPPAVIGRVSFHDCDVRGELISVLRLPPAMLRRDALDAVGSAIDLAVRRGCRVIGLGGLTSSATRGGAALVGRLPSDVVLTNGNAYTSVVVRSNVEQAAAALGLGSRARVAIVGATGSIGAAASRMLARRGFPLILIGRTTEKVRRLFADVSPGHVKTDRILAAREADVIVLLTSAPSARIEPQIPRPGAVIIDCAQPAAVSAEDAARFAANDVQAVTGGLATVEGYRCDFELRTPEPLTTFACLSETYLLARANVLRHSVGQVDVEVARTAERLAARYGVRPRTLPLRAPARDEPRTAVPVAPALACDGAGAPDTNAIEL